MASLVCATCRKLIPPGTNAIRCTVASCNTGRMKLRFCSVNCWEKHVPTARHRKASYQVEGANAPDPDTRDTESSE
jgi:LSD1 subclass zinc finger protein